MAITKNAKRNARRNVMSKKSLRKFGSGKDIGMSLLWYWISYVVVTWIGIGHTIFNILNAKKKKAVALAA